MEKEQLIKEIIEYERRFNRFLRQHTPDVWMSLNLTIPQLKSLFFIANQGITNIRNLATALRVTPSNVTGIVDRLVENGLISRQNNPDDRRMLMLKTTEKGENLITELRERKFSQMSALLQEMSTEELSTMAKGLALLVKAANSYKEPEKRNIGN